MSQKFCCQAQRARAFRQRSDSPSKKPLLGRITGRPLLFVALPALLVAGCGHQTQYSQPSWYAGADAAPRQTAAAVPIPVEMEDDGRPAQLPPRAEARRGPDDPSQPWSPNYGGPSTRAVERQSPPASAAQPRPAGRTVAFAHDAD